MYTDIPDQGIAFDKDGYPIDKHSRPNRDSGCEDKRLRAYSHPAQSHAGDRGPPSGGDSGDDSSYNDESKDEENESLPPTDGEEEFEEEFSTLQTSSGSRNYPSSRRTTSGSSRVHWYLESQTRPRSYRQGHTDELDSY